MKIRNVLNTIILFIVLSLTVGFSAFVSEMSISEIVADIRLNEDVRVTGVRVVDSFNANANEINYDDDSIFGNINLNTFEASLTLEVSITNFGNTPMGIYEITELSDDLGISMYNYRMKDKLCDSSGNCILGSTTTFNVVIRQNIDDVVTKDYDIRLDFNFKEIYSVTYINMSNNNYKNHVMKGETLNVNFGSDAPGKIKVFSNGILLDSSMYSYTNGILNVYNVTGDIEVKEYVPVAKVVKGDVNTVGSEVCIGNECFYVVSNDGTKVSMLSKYNLYVGSEYGVETFSYGDAATGIQDSTMMGYASGKDQFKGVTRFSYMNYWDGEVNSYPAYVYNVNSLLYNYVENYKGYLESLGGIIENARLITYEELVGLGCTAVLNDENCHSAPRFVYSTSYWTGSASDVSTLWRVYSHGILNSYFYYDDTSFGVRPVIEIDVNEIIDLFSFKIAGKIYYANEGMTWREWVDSDYNIDNEFYYDEDLNWVVTDSATLRIFSVDELIIENYNYSCEPSEGSIPDFGFE